MQRNQFEEEIAGDAAAANGCGGASVCTPSAGRYVFDIDGAPSLGAAVSVLPTYSLVSLFSHYCCGTSLKKKMLAMLLLIPMVVVVPLHIARAYIVPAKKYSSL